jgi:hypothetical protein
MCLNVPTTPTRQEPSSIARSIVNEVEMTPIIIGHSVMLFRCPFDLSCDPERGHQPLILDALDKFKGV